MPQGVGYGGSTKSKPNQKAGGRKGGKKHPHAGRMTEAQHKKFMKAQKDGLITKKQHDTLSAGLLEAIIKKKKGKK